MIKLGDEVTSAKRYSGTYNYKGRGEEVLPSVTY